ncbi:tripartite tricarboxylate transporter TctB family protein [Paraburkholderia sp. JPY465]|uniref:tripartite tricarboxylate transporter TctB family protein n=1 Tax=Paraburkholderia sp. JPY465 TaxID=3042285 RepID=UPI003D1BBF3A
MTLIGLGAAWGGSSYRIGTVASMEAGFFPTVLGILLTGTGLLLVLSACRRAKEPSAGADRGEVGLERVKLEFRGIASIILGIVVFQLFARYLGLVPATFAIVFICAMGRRDNGVLEALALASALTVVSVLLFHWALQLPMPLFQFPF